ncbi:MAG: helix-turn-helix transcriptional regulator [Chlamydiia bacterium]|nr:helix-turn-helix transcriptional regulator [Chlamydiia bacterium]
MEENVKKIGSWVKKLRKEMGITQESLALASGTGLRFISNLENGKPTCQIDKVLQVLSALRIGITLETSEGKTLKL